MARRNPRTGGEMRRFWPILLALLAALPATAADRAPTYLPTHDVAVSYQVSGKAAQQVRSVLARFSAARNLLRLETEDRAMGFVLVDLLARTAKLMVPSVHQAVDLPLARDRRAALLFGDGVRFTRRGNSHVLGRPCVDWDVQADRDTATVCLTADGVLLRAQGRGGEAADSSLVATRIDEAPQSPSLFRMPSGNGGMNLPDMLRPFLSPPR